MGVEQFKIGFIHKNAVRENREENIGLLPRRLEDVPAEQRLSAHQQDKTDAQRLRLVENGEPFVRRKLLHRRAVLRSVASA